MIVTKRRAAVCIVGLMCMVITIATNAMAEKIRVHYDHSLDFTKFKTYGWAPHGAVAHPMLALDMVGAVEQELNSRGLHKVAENPDLIIEFYGSIDTETSMTSNNPLYNATGGIPPFDPSMTSPGDSLYWDGYYGNSVWVVHPGQLVIDLIDFKNKKLAWRGFASEAVSPNNPDKLESEVNSTINKLFKEYPVKK
jgi:hypothetical protein